MPVKESPARSRVRRDAPAPARPAGGELAQSLLAWSAAAPVALAMVDGDGTVAWVNPAFERLTGFAAAEACGHRVQALLDAPLAAAWALDGNVARRLLHGRDGGALCCDLHATALPAPPGRWMLTLVDRGGETALASQLGRLAALLDFVQESAHIGTWERDIRTGEGRWDRHLFRFWGLDPSKGTPSMAEAAQATAPQDALLAKLTGSQAQPGRHQHRFRLVGADGEVRRIRAHWDVVTTPDGTPDRQVGLMMDDTETFSLASSQDQAHSQLQLAIELADLALWRHDLATNRFHYNDRAFRMMDMPPRPGGVPLEEVRSLIHPDDLAEVQACALRALDSFGHEDMQARYRRRDGTWRHILTRRVTQRDGHGRPVAFSGVALDITDQVERSQRASELARQLEDVASASGIGVWRVSSDVQHTEWNAQMYALHGRSMREPPPRLAEWVDTYVHPDDRERVREHARQWITSAGVGTELAHRIVMPDGRVRHVVDRGRIEPPGGPWRLAGVTIDVTDREAAVQALREATERSMLATRAAGLAIWEWDAATGESRWDEQMYRLRGARPRPGPAPSFEEMARFVHPDDQPKMAGWMERARSDDAVMDYEFRVVREDDGAVRRIASRSKTIRDEAGRVRLRLGVNWDVTEARESEAVRQERALALRESQAKSELLARMSHELRTPMNAVLGFTHLLLADDVEPGSTRALRLGHIRSAGEHLMTLINNVLELSRLDGNDRGVMMQPVALAPLVAQALPLVERLAEQNAVTVTAQPLPLAVHADPTRLKQVLLNLLTNAIKYNRHGGTVNVSAAVDASGSVVLRVADNGIGMTPEQQALVFEPFNRAGVERQDIEGTGIGLTIVKALVARMGGRVVVQSAPGEGSVFEVWLQPAPVLGEAGAAGMAGAARAAGAAGAAGADARVATALADVGEQGAPAAVDAADATGDGATPSGDAGTASPRRRVLYIEDNAVNVMIVQELVKRRGDLAFDAAPDGASGVERALRERPGLVLVDMQLPDINGLEVLRRLRADPLTQRLPCIALSANAMPEDIQRALQAGFDDYWTKPLDFALLRDALDRVFGPVPA